MLTRTLRTLRTSHRTLSNPRLPSRRSLSSSSSRLSPPTNSPPSLATRELLGQLATLLQRYPLVDPAWTNRIDRALADLEHPRKARVAVVGDSNSGAGGVVTALLDDPLSSNPDVTVALESRRLSSQAPEAIAIKFGSEGKASASAVELPSTWLRDNDAEVVEVLHGDGVPPLESSFSTLHLSDAVVVVLSAATLLSTKAAQTVLYNLNSKPNLFVALNAPDASTSASTSLSRSLEHQLGTLFPPSSSEPHPRTFVISTQQALAALEALSPSEPGQSPSYESFQKGYLSSQIPTLSSELSSALSSHSSLSPSALQRQTAAYVLLAALNRAAFSGAQIADALSSASSALSALSQQAEEKADALLASLGVDPSTGLLKVPEDELKLALSALDDLLLTRLAWYKLPYRVDDLPAEVALVVDKTYLPRFEDALVYAAGRAQALTATLSTSVDTLLAQPAFSQSPTSGALGPAARLASLYSATLRNRVAQAALTASQGGSSTALSSALVHRRNQITAPGGPTDALQRRAQKQVVWSSSLGVASVGGAIAAHVGEVAELATAGAWGALGVAVAAWSLQRGWEKAKKRFRKDVGQRITGGVEEDLGVAARRLVDRSLFKTRTAVALSEELIRQRQRDFEAFRAELAAIEAERRALEAAEEGEAVSRQEKRRAAA
ncbi:hypothetical protein JCM10207_001722 [Rhodosporidiobolus poonsookiae]